MLSRHGREGRTASLLCCHKHAGAGTMAGRIAVKGLESAEGATSRKGTCEHGIKKRASHKTVRIGPSDLSGCSRRATCRTRAGRGKGRALWHGIGPDGRSTAAHGGLAIFLTSPMARRNSQRAEKGGARRKFRNRQPGSARARLMNSFLPKFRYRRSRSRPNAPVGAVPAACELRACNSLLIYIPGKQPALGYCKQVK